MRTFLPENWKQFIVNKGASFVETTIPPLLMQFNEPNHELENIYSDLFTDISYLGLISITGIDAAKFLQGQFCCDVNMVTETTTTLGAYCNLKGRIVSFFRLMPLNFIGSQGYLLQAPIDTIESTIKILKKYAMFSKVTIKEVSGEISRIGLSATNAQKILSHIFKTDNIPSDINCCTTGNFAEGEFLISRISGFENNARFEIYSTQVTAMSKLWEELSKTIVPKSSNYWLQIDIANQIPQVTQKTQESLLPHHINLPQLGAVSFKKGCYLGQEIIARMEYKGKIKKHLQVLNFDNNTQPKVGSELVDSTNKDAGSIITVCKNNSGYSILACINDDAEGNLQIKA